ncbi:uncharacterized protein LOC120704743 isoform X7 [Panicum virgatum]|uniref:uncharacterized protein LOC120704743 isoform X7 n=1 Tax=Panicum virgatum TaxID=38727 RepID=UPI0019D5348A|nr:uncharacterized protein LOC120704743 isoform X7 [Panicum virgatum]
MGREPVQLRWAESGSSVTERTGATVLRRYGSCSIDFGRIGSIRPPPPLQIYFKHPGRSDPFQREPSSMVHLQGQPYICSPSRCRSFPQFEFLLSASLLSELTATEQKHPSNKNEHSLVESEQFTPVSVQIAALAEVPDLEAARVDRDIAAAPMEFSADWDLTGFISFEANEGSVEHMGSEHMGSLMQSIGSTNASGNEDDATSTLPSAASSEEHEGDGYKTPETGSNLPYCGSIYEPECDASLQPYLGMEFDSWEQDGTSRKNYSLFGDVISFDSTYRSNRSRSIKEVVQN